MRSTLILSLTTSLLALASAIAFADGPRLVSGGPRKPAARDAALAAVRAAQLDMAPCWRGSPPAEVHVALSVSATGEVVSSMAKVGGAAAQCAAGLLAVASLPAGERWTGVIVMAAGAPGAGRPSGGGLEGEITAQLGTHRATLAGCQSADPTSAGDLALALAIAPNGAITPTIASSSVSKKIEGCVSASLRRTRLSLSEQRAVRYQLSLSFAGAAAAPRPAADTTAGAPPSGSTPSLKVGSSLSAEQIGAVITARKADFLRCAKAASGDVTVAFTVRPDGTVKNVTVKSSTIGNAAIDSCVVGRVEALRFPAAAGESRVTWPFEFRTK